MLGAGMARAADLDIAFVGTLTGAKANTAIDQLDGFRLGIRHLGGRLGGLEYALSVIDEAHDTQKAKQAADDLWKNGRLHVLLISTTAEAAAYIAQQAPAHRTLVLNLGSVPPPLAGRECSPTFFSLVPRGDMIQELTGAYLWGQGYRRLAVFEPPGRTDTVAAFRRGFKGEVTEIVSHPGTMDFSPDLQKLSKLKVDAAYLTQSGGMAVEFLLQYAAGGFKESLPLFAPAGTFDQTTLAASAPAALDLFSVAPWSDDLDSPANHRLIADFEPDYGRPVSMRAASGYDAAMLLEAAIREAKAKVNDTDAFRLAVKRVEFPSTRGGFRFDNDQFPLLTYWVRQVAQDQRGRLINEQRGQLQKDVRDVLAGECPMSAAPPPPPKK
ncbi:MAG TPA: ABC transporter substrate-binding protein [Magnetospirillaceae bacterium]|nr:ABC transporter substrate-binding protein [Magnetospirillaceae bacterium]